MIWRVDVYPRNNLPCASLTAQMQDAGVKEAIEVFPRKVYFIEADFSQEQIAQAAGELLIDPVVERYSLSRGFFQEPPRANQILITFNPGVCDAVALSLEKAMRELGLPAKACRTARFYEFRGLKKTDINAVSSRVLYNPLIEHALEYDRMGAVQTLDEFAGRDYAFRLVVVDILSCDEEELLAVSRTGCLSLDRDEMKIIQDYFRRLGRNPTDCELETIATLWSEHCAHKTFRGRIEYEEKDSRGATVSRETIDSLLKSTIMRATATIGHPDCVSVFSDNSGVVAFDGTDNICCKVETHNHPSSLEPYGGASTGIGGVIRDILGTGCAARPFASIDVFCFSPWHISHSQVPEGLLHPKRVITGVVKGVRDYGNRMGIPTVAGAVLFDERFLGNPLVYCGTLGIIPKNKSFKKSQAGDLVILCGARTGRDGIHGATFSSKELDEQTVGLTSAVQIGNPIEEKKLTEAILRARDKDLFSAITDCGAGGISSAITELSKGQGVEVYLDQVPLKYRGLSYTEIWISESQERMVFFTRDEHLPELKKIFNQEDVELSVVGRVNASQKLTLYYQQQKVCELDMDFLFELPELTKKAVWLKHEESQALVQEKNNYNDDLKKLLARPGIASKDWVVREYDHEVQGGSVIKALAGGEPPAANDASVVRPDLSSAKAVAIGLGINPFYSDLDPYWMAALSIDEALRNVIAVGASIEKTFLLDNFSWGSPQQPEQLAGLVRACKACYDFATYFGTPFISGKDSLYNEYVVGQKRIAIPGTLLVSAIAVLEDWRKTVTASLKKAGNLLYMVGYSLPELGASEYFRSQGVSGGIVPKVNTAQAKDIFLTLSRAIAHELVVSCHDCSEGGLAVAAAEMCIGSGLGASLFLKEMPCQAGMRDYELLFCESASRFVVEVEQPKKEAFEEGLAGIPLGLIGCVSDKQYLAIYGLSNRPVIDAALKQLTQAWLGTFQEFRYTEQGKSKV